VHQRKNINLVGEVVGYDLEVVRNVVCEARWHRSRAISDAKLGIVEVVNDVVGSSARELSAVIDVCPPPWCVIETDDGVLMDVGELRVGEPVNWYLIRTIFVQAKDRLTCATCGGSRLEVDELNVVDQRFVVPS